MEILKILFKNVLYYFSFFSLIVFLEILILHRWVKKEKSKVEEKVTIDNLLKDLLNDIKFIKEELIKINSNISSLKISKEEKKEEKNLFTDRKLDKVEKDKKTPILSDDNFISEYKNLVDELRKLKKKLKGN